MRTSPKIILGPDSQQQNTAIFDGGTKQRRRKQIESGWVRAKIFFAVPPPHFSAVPTQFGGHCTHQSGTKMGSHSPLFVRKEMAKES